MARLKQNIRIKKASNKKAKYKVKTTKYSYASTTKSDYGSSTSKYSYISKKLTVAKVKNKYSYI